MLDRVDVLIPSQPTQCTRTSSSLQLDAGINPHVQAVMISWQLSLSIHQRLLCRIHRCISGHIACRSLLRPASCTVQTQCLHHVPSKITPLLRHAPLLNVLAPTCMCRLLDSPWKKPFRIACSGCLCSRLVAMTLSNVFKWITQLHRDRLFNTGVSVLHASTIHLSQSASSPCAHVSTILSLSRA